MNPLFISTGLDKENLEGKLVGVIEESTASSCAVICSFAVDALQHDKGLIVCSLHYSFVHYRLILGKFGANLSTALTEGQAIHIDNLLLEGSLLEETIQAMERLRTSYNSVTVLVDDMSDLLMSGHTFQTTMEFLQGLRLAAARVGNISLVVGAHWNAGDIQLSSIKSYIDSIADFRIHISPLSTGLSREVSGGLIYSKFDPGLASTWSLPMKLHFKLSERMVKYFSPGSIIQ